MILFKLYEFWKMQKLEKKNRHYFKLNFFLQKKLRFIFLYVLKNRELRVKRTLKLDQAFIRSVQTSINLL